MQLQKKQSATSDWLLLIPTTSLHNASREIFASTDMGFLGDVEANRENPLYLTVAITWVVFTAIRPKV